MSRRRKGFSSRQILDELDSLPDLPDEDDDDLEDIDIEPEDAGDDGITETEEVVYENPVSYRNVSSFQSQCSVLKLL
jgi:hypothetical protein